MGLSAYELSIAGQRDYGRLCPSIRLGVALVFAFVWPIIVRIAVVIIIIIVVVVDLSGLLAFGLVVFARRSIGVVQD